jgi:hypothetical protein
MFPFVLLPAPLGGEVLLTAAAAEIRPLSPTPTAVFFVFAVLLVVLM